MFYLSKNGIIVVSNNGLGTARLLAMSGFSTNFFLIPLTSIYLRRHRTKTQITEIVIVASRSVNISPRGSLKNKDGNLNRDHKPNRVAAIP